MNQSINKCDLQSCEPGADGCTNYKVLDDPRRNRNYKAARGENSYVIAFIAVATILITREMVGTSFKVRNDF